MMIYAMISMILTAVFHISVPSLFVRSILACLLRRYFYIRRYLASFVVYSILIASLLFVLYHIYVRILYVHTNIEGMCSL